MNNMWKKLMSKWRNRQSDQSGLTIIELLISIAIGSVVMVMLMQMLVMNIRTQRLVEFENMVIDQSYLLGERIQANVFNLQPHSIEIVEDSPTQTIIHITHEYDITVGVGNVIIRDYSNPVTDILTYDKVNQQLTYNGNLLHSSKIKIENGSSVSLIEIDPDTCAIEPSNDICDDGIIRLELIISYEYSEGNRSDTRTFVTTIIV